jgi:hypothetical protein
MKIEKQDFLISILKKLDTIALLIGSNGNIIFASRSFFEIFNLSISESTVTNLSVDTLFDQMNCLLSNGDSPFTTNYNVDFNK